MVIADILSIGGRKKGLDGRLCLSSSSRSREHGCALLIIVEGVVTEKGRDAALKGMHVVGSLVFGLTSGGMLMTGGISSGVHESIVAIAPVT